MLFAIFATVVVALGGGGLAALESDTVGSYWEGLWWALSLMTTVGFIGGAPQSDAGRLVSALLMLSGFGLLTLTTAAVATLFVAEEEEEGDASARAFEASATVALQDLTGRLEAIEGAIEALRRDLAERSDLAERGGGAGRPGS